MGQRALLSQSSVTFSGFAILAEPTDIFPRGELCVVNCATLLPLDLSWFGGLDKKITGRPYWGRQSPVYP